MSDRIAEIKARLEAATPGPWNISNGIFFGNWPVGTLVTGRDGESDKDYIVNIVSDAAIYPPSTARTDAEFIAAAPDDIAYLLAEVERLRAVLMEIADMQPVWDASGNAGLIVVQGMVRAALDSEPYDAGADLDGETAGVCETCGKPMQHVRPGKWQCPECG